MRKPLQEEGCLKKKKMDIINVAVVVAAVAPIKQKWC